MYVVITELEGLAEGYSKLKNEELSLHITKLVDLLHDVIGKLWD